ncbi:MAG TPA: hypothetical protein PLD46_04285 [Hyphomicrobium sp.]|mgnify:CR=1 FL=1|nr:hypothetical protein [Hyphomicrobium sp.]
MRFLGSLIGTVVLLVVELVLTMLVYTGLNIYNLELFGSLVRTAGGVLEFMASLFEQMFAGSANAAYASVFGELGPKAMLLLLLGLVVAAVVRLITGLFRGLRS